MLREVQQVLRLLMVLGKQRQRRAVKPAGGLLVLLWPENGASFLNCAVAAAGSWCTGIKMDQLKPVLTDLKRSLFLCTGACPEPDLEELHAFTELCGSLRLLLSFQMKDTRLFSADWQAHLKAFLHTFSLANAGIKIHLKFKYNQQTLQQEFRVKFKCKVAQVDQPSLILDVTSNMQPPECVKKGCWCQGGHPVLGSRVPLSISPHVMDQGLYGELGVQFVTLLSPCVLQYPNLATQLTHIQVFVYSPSNVPVVGLSTFFQTLPDHLDCQQMGLHGLYCSPLKVLQHASHLDCSGGIIYTVEQENSENPQQESGLPSAQQSLQLFFFLQHSDPFTSELSDVMAAAITGMSDTVKATESIIEQHLGDILNNNKQAVTTAVQTDLKNALKTQNHRKKDQEKLHLAVKVIVSSSISIVSCSSNMDFRNACLNSMKVCDTHELSTALFESLRRVTSWKFKPNAKCYSAQTDECLGSDESTRTEI